METKRPRNIILLLTATLLLLPFGTKAENTGGDDSGLPEVFPTEDAEWEYGSVYIRDGTEGFVIYTLRGDTIIDNHTYNFIFIWDAKCIGLTRVEGNKVFFRPEGYAISDSEEDRFKYEYLIYYFPDASGERIDTPNAPDPERCEDFYASIDGGGFIVNKVEKEVYDIVSVKYYDREDTPLVEDKWIKGVGGMNGFWQGRCHIINGHGYIYHLKNLRYKGKQIYPAVTGIEQTGNDKKAMVSFIDGEIIIRAEDTKLPCKFILADTYGKIIKDIAIINTGITVGTSGFPSGIYIYRLSGAGINQTGKLIIR